MKLPRSVSRGKTLLLKTLRKTTAGHGVVGVVRSPLGSIIGSPSGSGHGHGKEGRTSRTATPTFEFRDPQPTPESIRMQYAELAPSDGSASSGSVGRKEQATKVGGMLAVPDAETARRMKAQRERTSSMASTVRPATVTDARRRSRSRSLHSRRSAETMGGTTAAHLTNAMTHDISGSTAVGHGEPLKSPTYSNSISTSSSDVQRAQVHSRMHSLRQRNRAVLTTGTTADQAAKDQVALTKAKKREMRLANHKNELVRAGAPVMKVLHSLARLPWMAEHEHARGELIPEDEPRVTTDFIPSRSGRGRDKVRGLLNGNPTTTAADAIYQAMRAKERAAGEDGASYGSKQEKVPQEAGESWYKPRARPRSMNYTVGTPKSRPKSGIGGGMKQAYRAYRAAAAGRPLGYMYASPSTSSSARYSNQAGAVAAAGALGASSGQAYANAIMQTPQRVSRATSGGASSNASRPSIAAAASAYLTRSTSSSASSGRQHAPQQTAYHYGQTSSYMRPMPVGMSPALPPIPPASSSASHSHDGHGFPSVPTVKSELSSTSGSAASSATATLHRSQSHSLSDPRRTRSQLASNYASNYSSPTHSHHQHQHQRTYSQGQGQSQSQSNYAGYGGYGGYGYAAHPGPVLAYSPTHSSATQSSLGQGASLSSGGHGYYSGGSGGYGHAAVQSPVRYQYPQYAYVPNAR